MSAAPAFVPGFFGKLPFAPDFVSHHGRAAEEQEFERWLQDGVSLARARFSAAADGMLRRMPQTCFLIGAGPKGQTLLGLLLPGYDKSGRSFPFALWIRCRIDQLNERLFLIPRLFEDLFTWAAGVGGRTHGNIEELIRDAEAFPGSLPSEESRSATSPASILGGAQMGTFPDGSILPAARNLLSLSRHYAGRADLPAFGLRFPVPEGSASGGRDACLSFWLEAVRRAFELGNRLPLLFWSAGSASDGFLDFYFESPGGMALLHILDPAFDSDGLYPVREGGQEMEEIDRTLTLDAVLEGFFPGDAEETGRAGRG